MPQFKFIAVEGGDGTRPKLNGSIRSHAIRTSLQKNPRRRKAKTTVGATKSGGEAVLRFDLDEPAEASHDRRISDPRLTLDIGLNFNSVGTGDGGTHSAQLPKYHMDSVCAASLDPFNALPIPTNLEIDYLVRYFLIKFDFCWATPDSKRSWLPYALQSAPMMHSTLAMAAALWRAESPHLEQSLQLEGMRQKGEAMREIRSRLLHPVSTRQQKDINLLMATMSTLVIAEACEGDFKAAEMHLQGVHNLFSSRGGRDTFGDDLIVCKSINVADIQVAAALGHQLTFPLLHEDQLQLPVAITKDAQYPPFDHSIIEGSSNTPASIFMQLRQLLAARHSVISSDELQILLNNVDESVLQHLYQDCTDISETSRRSRTLVLAAHVFLYRALRQMPPRSPVVRRICIKLQDTIGLTPAARGIWAQNEAALMWMAFVGLLGTAEGSPERQWFLNVFHSTVKAWAQDFPLKKDAIYGVLSTFLWDEASCRPLLDKLVES